MLNSDEIRRLKGSGESLMESFYMTLNTLKRTLKK